MSIDTTVYNEHYPYIAVSLLMKELEEEREIGTGFSAYEEYAKVINAIVERWENKEDLSSEEEDNLLAYANRILHELYSIAEY